MKKKLESLCTVAWRVLFGIFHSVARRLRDIIGTSPQECSSTRSPYSDRCPPTQPEHHCSGLAQAGGVLPIGRGVPGWNPPQDLSAIGSQDGPARHVLRSDRSDMPIHAVVSRLLAGGRYLDEVIPWLVFLPNVQCASAGAVGSVDESRLEGLCPSDGTACSALVRLRLSLCRS